MLFSCTLQTSISCKAFLFIKPKALHLYKDHIYEKHRFGINFLIKFTLADVRQTKHQPYKFSDTPLSPHEEELV